LTGLHAFLLLIQAAESPFPAAFSIWPGLGRYYTINRLHLSFIFAFGRDNRLKLRIIAIL